MGSRLPRCAAAARNFALLVVKALSPICGWLEIAPRKGVVGCAAMGLVPASGELTAEAQTKREPAG